MNLIPAVLLSALIMVESGGNDRAIGSKGELGPLQIMPSTLADVERISGHHFTREDAFNRETACRIATIYLIHYGSEKRLGREATFRDYALIWHHGPNGWKRPEPSRYWQKVQRYLP
jgi:hypothetical protein